MIHSFVATYEKGAITADHLVAQSLEMIDPDNPGLVLGGLPVAILDRLFGFVQRTQHERIVTNYGKVPTLDQLEAAKEWIEGRAVQLERASLPQS